MSADSTRSELASLDRIRAVADAVLYEGYLLYPYRATSRKNQVRWQFGVLGPQGADNAGLGEDAHLSLDCLVDAKADERLWEIQATLSFHVRFLQLQERRTEQVQDGGGYLAVPELRVGPTRRAHQCQRLSIEPSGENGRFRDRGTQYPPKYEKPQGLYQFHECSAFRDTSSRWCG